MHFAIFLCRLVASMFGSKNACSFTRALEILYARMLAEPRAFLGQKSASILAAHSNQKSCEPSIIAPKLLLILSTESPKWREMAHKSPFLSRSARLTGIFGESNMLSARTYARRALEPCLACGSHIKRISQQAYSYGFIFL